MALTYHSNIVINKCTQKLFSIIHQFGGYLSKYLTNNANIKLHFVDYTTI